MKIVLLIVGGLAAIVLIALAIGAALPVHHTASRSLFLRKAPAEVFAVVADFARAPEWRPGLERVEVLSPTRFREHAKYGVVTYDVVENSAPHRLVTRIADQNLGYGGTWTYVAVPENGGTRLEITEEGDVTNVFFRFMSRFVFGHTSSIDAYLAALGKRLA